QGVKKPFTKVVECHWGDAQALGQKPITFLRQVMAVCTFPELQHDASIPEDAKHRAKKILESCDGGSIGAYNHSQSLTYIQRKLAKYIERRDGGVASHPHHIYIMNGTSTCITIMMNMLITGEGACRTGLLTPSPQFPSFASIISLLDGVHVKYLLNEERGWTLEIPELQRALTQARTHCNPLVLSVINPHNPTGHVMTRKTIEDVIKFAAKEKLFLLVDEV
uniref:Alanine aminotransferase 1 n=2 Tax=Callorhinchus milii TaxID=7868 RepID=A0A4W3GJM1_CALMI